MKIHPLTQIGSLNAGDQFFSESDLLELQRGRAIDIRQIADDKRSREESEFTVPVEPIDGNIIAWHRPDVLVHQIK